MDKIGCKSRGYLSKPASGKLNYPTFQTASETETISDEVAVVLRKLRLNAF